jgi:phosphate transport system substrate-binding protein
MNTLHVSLAALAGFAAVVAAPLAWSQKSPDLSSMKGSIKIDGSSTVYPITEAVAEEFKQVARNVRVTVGISGTGGGFKKFTVGETDISDASRPIKKTEVDLAKQNSIEFIELPVAYDGLSIVVNKANYWVDHLTLDEIKKIFVEGGGAKSWKDLRADWPDRAIKIYAPGTDSGTFDYFKEVVAGERGAIRSDMSVSEDDNVLVKGVAGDDAAIGFFGCAYYFENKDKLKIVPIVNPKTNQPVEPTPVTIEDGSYAPFSRPLFIYVSAKAAERPEVQAFVDFYLKNVPQLAGDVGYVRLPQAVYNKAASNFKTRKTGTQFLNDKGESVHGPVTKIYN